MIGIRMLILKITIGKHSNVFTHNGLSYARSGKIVIAKERS